ncbi:hypothetical protein [Catenuloplanes atrovinosus]|uniref:Uncharacterized protein n=1 Tax=Catenuloplanes atrovinosus TaxID=137266 RepID=A0AAE3YNK0_9ACTN|nr:hypothetical protein [Catenuloplanes atrovinosus]MDR7277103.1 hypothetical protein [Catenuloplanes atrovinosus]
MPEPSATSGTGPMVAEASYRELQLCALGRTPAERSESPRLRPEDARDLLTRLNALPTEPPGPGCDGVPASPTHLLVLRDGARSVVVSLDTGPCDTVLHSTGVRYGAGEIHRLAEELIAEYR